MDPRVLESLQFVSSALRALGIEDVVFVGGAAVGLLLTDPAAPEPRFTVDIDIVTRVQTRAAYYALEDTLRDAGYTQPLDGPICRWNIDGVLVDVMPMDASILGFSNRWYPQLVEHARTHSLHDGSSVLVASPPYLVATKLEAYADRGAADMRLSHDLEDVIIIFDGRPELVEEILSAPSSVRTWIREAIRKMLASHAFREALVGHLPPDAASQARAPEVFRRMRVVADLEAKSEDSVHD